ncbi:hypothetical protein ACFV29_17715 [Streptomyces sp. NPDC059690]|uniref:hypothetical protein n=1 Tax=Streptomyces sp. NPDC059690 TaxID=3346907 RepID=UPI0036958415
MIKQVCHPGAGTAPTAFTLALEVAYELHAPAGRAPEVAPAVVAGRRTTSARTRRRTVRG